MAMPKRWAVREAAIASFYDIDTHALKVSLNTLKMTEVQTTGETVYATGGRGNAKLVAFSGNREATVTIQDAIFDNAALAMLTGNAVITNYTAVTTKNQTFTIEADASPSVLTVNLADTASVIGVAAINKTTGTVLTEMESAVAVVSANQFYVAANGVVTLFSEVTAKEVAVTYTVTGAAGTATQIQVTSDKFAGTYELVCDVIVRDELTAKDYYGQFIAPKVKINDEFTFSFAPDGDPSVLDIPIEILKPSSSTTMWELIIYDEVV